MRKHRLAVGTTTALLVCAGSVSAPFTAYADSTSTFYVNNATSASCSDSTTDSSATPYCTIQAAVNAATAPGDTVVVAQGTYTPFTVKSSGTAAAPITIEGPASPLLNLYPMAYLQATLADNEPVVSIDGASYVTLDDFEMGNRATQSVVSITASSHVTVDSSQLISFSGSANDPVPIALITGQSDSVTLSRDYLNGNAHGGGVAIDGGSGDTITTSKIVPLSGAGIALDHVTGAAVTSNTVQTACEGGIDVADGSTSASIENNIVRDLSDNAPDQCSTATQASGAALGVDSASTKGTTADYNTLSTGSPSLPDVYAWAGNDYASTAAFTAATGQGAHDSTQTVDSANSDAPGELATDMYGNPRVDDPDVTDTGAGTHTYYDRGVAEAEDPVNFSNADSWPTKAPVGGMGTYTTTASDPWGNSVTGCTYSFGDGSAPVSVTPSSDGTCTAQHAYASTAYYSIVLTVSLSDGYDSIDHVNVVEVVAASGAGFGVSLSAGSQGSLGVAVSATQVAGDWNLASCSFDFGDGTAPVVQHSCNMAYRYKTPGARTITLTATDAGGNQTTETAAYTSTGSFFTPVTPTRVLDTRVGTGVPSAGPVAADGTVKLKIAGVDGLPATGVTAVALNVTATDATKIGLIAAYPDGATLPNVSNVDFKANQNVANTVIVEVGSDGYVDLANQSAGTTDILADLEGYYSMNATSGYTSVNQVRLLDTRKTVPVAAGSTVKLPTSAYPGISAAVLNLTVVDATGNGYVTAYPDGGTVPSTSNLNYLAGQTATNEVVASVGSDGDIDFTNSGKGQADLLVDLSGYFTPGSGEAFTPITPERYLDTRSGYGKYNTGTPYHLDLQVAGACPAQNASCTAAVAVPEGASAIAANVTVTQPTANGYLIAFPGGQTSVPNASLLNYRAGQQIQNALTVGLGSGGDFYLDNVTTGSTQTIADVFGYYSN